MPLAVWLSFRGIRHHFSKHLLGAAGVFLSVFLVASTVAGLAEARRAGVAPIRAYIGGDIMIKVGELVLFPSRFGVGFETSPESWPLFDPTEVLKQLVGYKTTLEALVPVHIYGRGETWFLLARSTAGGTAPSPPVGQGRFLGEGDRRLPVAVVKEWSGLGRYCGERFKARLPAFDEDHHVDFTSGKDVDFEVVGIMPGMEPTTNLPYVPLEFIRETTGLTGVSHIGVAVDSYSNLDRTAADLRRALPGYEVLTSEQLLAKMDFETAKVQRAAIPITALVLGCACVSVLNTFLLLVRIRRREVALLRVLGFPSGQVSLMLVLEGFFVVALAGLGGCLAAFGVRLFSGRFVLPVGPVAIGLGVLTVAGLATALPPAIWASRYSPMEVMRNA